METNKTNKGKSELLNLSFEVQDERLHIPLTIKTADGDVILNLYFNPSDPHIYTHIEALDTNNIPEINIAKGDTYSKFASEIAKFNEYVDFHFDEIFGAGKSREIWKYNSTLKNSILTGLMQKVRQGIEWFNEQAETERKTTEAQNRKDKMEQAKIESKKYLANV